MSAALALSLVCSFSPFLLHEKAGSYIITKSAAVTSSSLESKMVLLAIVCWSPLKHAAAVRHATCHTGQDLKAQDPKRCKRSDAAVGADRSRKGDQLGNGCRRDGEWRLVWTKAEW